MEIYENTNVLDEVELLFKKLDGLPDNVEQSVFSKIQEKLPSQDNSHIDVKTEGKVKRKIRREKEFDLSGDDFQGDQDEYSVVNVLTSREENTQQLSLFEESSNRSVESQIQLQQSDDSDTLFTTQYPWIDHQYEAWTPQYITAPIRGGLSTCFDRNSDDSVQLCTDDTYDKTGITGNQDEKILFAEKSEPTSKKVDPSKTPYVCTECRKAYSSSYLLRTHMKNHRGEKDFMCDQCPFRTLTKANLNQHMVVHKNEKDYMCEYCGRLFRSHSGLQSHIQINHLHKKKYSCTECDYGTYSKLVLHSHVQVKHNSENSGQHICPVCGLLVTQRYLLLKHITVHTHDRPHKCDQCTKTFSTNDRLTAHVKSVHTPRQFKCDYCSKFFQTKFHVQRHLKTHFNDRLYQCPYCNYASSTHGNLSKHVRNVHRKSDFSLRRLKAMKRLPPSDGSELEWLERSQTVVKNYLEKLGNRIGTSVTLESLCEEERKRKQLDNILLPKNKKSADKVHPVDHSYSEKADVQKTIQISPVSHDPLLTTSDSQLLNLEPSVAETEFIYQSDISLQDCVMEEMQCDLNPVEVITSQLDIEPKQDTVVVIIGSTDGCL